MSEKETEPGDICLYSTLVPTEPPLFDRIKLRLTGRSIPRELHEVRFSEWNKIRQKKELGMQLSKREEVILNTGIIAGISVATQIILEEEQVFLSEEIV